VLNAALREQIALAVAGENHCNYCASAHTFLAKRAGVDAAEAALNLDGEASDPRTDAILRFARTVVRSRAGWLESRNALNELRELGVSDAEIVEVLAHIGLNLFTNYFNHVVDTEIDFPRVIVDATRSAA
jgi:AhpD family alkylhydroperoxidase